MKNKQGQSKTNWMVIGGVIVAIVLLVYFFSAEVGLKLPTKTGEIINGYYDVATDQCWPDKDSPAGGQYPIGDKTIPTMFQCCLNQAGQQVDCNEPSTLLGPFAIYRNQTGIFSVAHTITVTNTGNVVLTNAWIDSAPWTPAHADLTTAYSGLLSSTSTQAGPINLDSYRVFSTSSIDLQAIGGEPGSPITYDLLLVTKASATGLGESLKETPISMTVEKEGILFSVDISLGA